jgi:hypothetical protein
MTVWACVDTSKNVCDPITSNCSPAKTQPASGLRQMIRKGAAFELMQRIY